MISFKSSSEATAIRIKETGNPHRTALCTIVTCDNSRICSSKMNF